MLRIADYPMQEVEARDEEGTGGSMKHIFNIAIDMDDERIIRAVEEDAETRIINTLTEKTLDAISTKEGYYSNRRDFSPLKEMAMNVVTEMVSRHKDYIIGEAIKEVAKKIYSSKACKDAATKML